MTIVSCWKFWHLLPSFLSYWSFKNKKKEEQGMHNILVMHINQKDTTYKYKISGWCWCRFHIHGPLSSRRFLSSFLHSTREAEQKNTLVVRPSVYQLDFTTTPPPQIYRLLNAQMKLYYLHNFIK